jgi:cytidyltransferase-like protein
MTDWGMIHGRFQPFHNGHLEYLLAAAARCERLLVGITNPDRLRTRPEPEDPLRHLPESNPFTYTERLLMAEAAARAAGVAVTVIPFPINDPATWSDYVPPGTVQFIRLFSAWGDAKLERFRDHGYAVVVLEADRKRVSGQQVRAAMRAGGDWAALVPPAVAEVIATIPDGRAPTADHPA